MQEHDDQHGIGARNDQPPVGKTHDRDPTITRHQDGLTAVLERKNGELIEELSGILGLPEVETEDLVTS